MTSHPRRLRPRSCSLGVNIWLREGDIDTEDVGIGMLGCEGDSPDAGTTTDVDDALVGRLE